LYGDAAGSDAAGSDTSSIDSLPDIYATAAAPGPREVVRQDLPPGTKFRLAMRRVPLANLYTDESALPESTIYAALAAGHGEVILVVSLGDSGSTFLVRE